MARPTTIRIYRGDTWSELGWGWWAPDVDGLYFLSSTEGMKLITAEEIPEDERYSPISLASARMQFRLTTNTEDPQLELTEDAGLDLSTPGRVFPSLTAVQTEDLLSGVWDVEVTSASGQIQTLDWGPVIVKGDVTRDEVVP